ncbi:hypothetical protein BDY24DRAFT_140919 [Mrakia frigida]|uniref:zinc finger MYND domain-containing protein n=1 Tax=Mrakia frigida TaxID=29902 RepID=UPI003FCBF516
MTSTRWEEKTQVKRERDASKRRGQGRRERERGCNPTTMSPQSTKVALQIATALKLVDSTGKKREGVKWTAAEAVKVSRLGGDIMLMMTLLEEKNFPGIWHFFALFLPEYLELYFALPSLDATSIHFILLSTMQGNGAALMRWLRLTKGGCARLLGEQVRIMFGSIKKGMMDLPPNPSKSTIEGWHGQANLLSTLNSFFLLVTSSIRALQQLPINPEDPRLIPPYHPSLNALSPLTLSQSLTLSVISLHHSTTLTHALDTSYHSIHASTLSRQAEADDDIAWLVGTAQTCTVVAAVLDAVGKGKEVPETEGRSRVDEPGKKAGLSWVECEARKDSVGGRCVVEEEGKGKMMACGKCQMVRYCSRDHQRAHWPAHKIVCVKPGF